MLGLGEHQHGKEIFGGPRKEQNCQLALASFSRAADAGREHQGGDHSISPYPRKALCTQELRISRSILQGQGSNNSNP